MKIIYRISDNSLNKPRVPGANKERCLKNCLNVFRNHDFFILADNCSESLPLVKNSGVPFEETQLGNAQSFLKCLEISSSSDGVVYFIEDDYYHQPNADLIVEEGLKFSNYVTIYDHPDKYTGAYNYGEVSKVMKTPSGQHWKYTASTCMTFATMASTIKQDMDIFKNLCQQDIPKDHQIFLALAKKGCTLAAAIPGAAVHMDLSACPDFWIDEWAWNQLLDDIQVDILKMDQSLKEMIVGIRDGKNKIQATAILATLEKEISSRLGP